MVVLGEVATVDVGVLEVSVVSFEVVVGVEAMLSLAYL